MTWKRLLKKFNFFKAFTHFIEIDVMAVSDDIQEKWAGFIESRLRKLLQKLEMLNSHKSNCLEFRPWPRSYRLDHAVFPCFDAYFFGVRVKRNDAGALMRIDLTESIKIFYKQLRERMAQDEKLMNLIIEKKADIKIKYMR